MALTETQKTQVRMYLGYERGYDRASELESKLADGALSATEETQVGTILTRLTALDTAIDTLTTGGAARVKEVDEIVFQDDDAFAQYRAQGRSLVMRLTALLGVPANIDYYGDGGGALGAPIPLG